DILEYRIDAGSWIPYIDGDPISTTGATSVDVRTYRIATGTDCNTSSANMVSWTVVAQPASGSFEERRIGTTFCAGGSVSALLTTPGSGGTGTMADVLEYRIDAGSWTAYVDGASISTTGASSVDVRTYRTATGTDCNTSSANMVSWTVVAQPASG